MEVRREQATCNLITRNIMTLADMRRMKMSESVPQFNIGVAEHHVVIVTYPSTHSCATTLCHGNCCPGPRSVPSSRRGNLCLTLIAGHPNS